MKVTSYKCDICEGPIKTRVGGHPQSIDTFRVEVKSDFEFEILRVNLNSEGDWEDQHVCKYCFIDAVNKLDDRDNKVGVYS